MNKLIVGNEDDISDIIVTEDMYIRINLNGTSKIINIDIMDNQNLKVFETDRDTSNKITYNIRAGASLIVNKLAFDNSDITTVNLIGEGANVTYNSSIVNYSDNVYVQNINHKASHTKSAVINHGINVNDRAMHFNVFGNVSRECIECSSHQDNRIINIREGKSFIAPNLIVDNNMVDLYHSAYIGDFDQETIFYLKTRGLNDKVCNNLLIKGFLFGNMELNEREREDFLKLTLNI